MSPRFPTQSLIPNEIMARLIANGMAEDEGDRVPVLKLFNPVGPGRWLITEIAQDADSLFGLCDLDLGCPELGYVSLDALEALLLPFGMRIARDPFFVGHAPLSRWASLARRLGSIHRAERVVRWLHGPGRGMLH